MHKGKRLIDSFLAMNPEIQSAHEDAQRVVKKQRVCGENARESMDSLIALVTDMQHKLQHEDRDAEALKQEFEQLQTTIENEEHLRNMTRDTRELHSAISKLGKVPNRHLHIIMPYRTPSLTKVAYIVVWSIGLKF